MLKKSERLLVGEKRKTRVTFRSDHFTLNVYAGSAAHSRFGIALGKAAAQRAVKRNALKRTFFLVAERIRGTLPPRDFLVVAGLRAGELTKEKQQEELKKLFAQVR